MRLSLMPLLPFTIVFILGILLEGWGVGAWFMVVPLIGAIILWLFRQPYGVLMCCGLMSGFAVGFVSRPASFPMAFSGISKYYSAVALEVKSYEPTQIIIARIDRCEGVAVMPFMAKLTVPSSLPAVDECERLRFSSSLQPSVARLDLPDEIDYDEPLRRMGVVGQGFVRPDSLEVVGGEPGLINDIRRFRSDLILAIVRLPVSDPVREFLCATIAGDRSMLTADLRELFSSTGLSHILALSGLHTGILAWIISVALLPLYIAGLRWLRIMILLIVLWGFAVMTGLPPSVVRSVVMATVFLLAYSFQRTRTPFNSLCVAALVILVFSPRSIYTVSFQMSFLAVASILVFAEKFNPFPRRSRFLHGIAAYPAVTLAAMAGTAVVSAAYFNIVPLMFLPANIIGALLLPPVIICGIVMLVAGVFGLTLMPVAWLTDKMFGVITDTAEFLSGLSGAVVRDVYVGPSVIIVWFFALIPLGLWLYRRRMVYAVATALCFCFLAVTFVYAGQQDDSGVEAYIPRSLHHTSLVVREGRTMKVFTTLPPHRHSEIHDDYSRRYRKYMLKRNVDSLLIRTVSPSVAEVVDVAGKRFMLLCGNNSFTLGESVSQIDYLVVCAGFRGDIVKAVASMSPDSVLLSSDLNNRRHNRYMDELARAGIPVRSIKNSPFGL
ncbi:MAG: ComEC/Rec2 family competence protein [Muribaculaceae bacterium]|nr:ComEC/Rec2 family competence protein [Muribaculaceae bacterium]